LYLNFFEQLRTNIQSLSSAIMLSGSHSRKPLFIQFAGFQGSHAHSKCEFSGNPQAGSFFRILHLSCIPLLICPNFWRRNSHLTWNSGIYRHLQLLDWQSVCSIPQWVMSENFFRPEGGTVRQVFYCSEIFHDCRFVASSSSRDEAIAQAAAHAREAHHIEDFTPEIAELVRAAIHEQWAGAA
jgi:predicted small metal-binding protein